MAITVITNAWAQATLDFVLKTAKAWVAAIIPIVVGLIADFGGSATINTREWFAILGVATAQWVGVYFKANQAVPDRPLTA